MPTFIGVQVGERWEARKDSLHYVDYAVAAVHRHRRRLPVVRYRRGRRDAARRRAEAPADA